MTISSETRTAGPFSGNGVTTAFPFTFKVFTTADVLVVQTDDDGVESTLVLTTNYTVSLNADQDVSPGGTVTMLVAPPTGYLLTLTSNIGNLQGVQITNQGGFYPSVINTALDRLTILVQQLLNKINRSIKIPLSDGSLTTELPTAALRANRALVFDSDGNVDVSTDEYVDSTAAAAASASAAAASASDAADSADAASDSETAAAASAAAALVSEQAAAATVGGFTGDLTVDVFSGTGAQTAFVLSVTPASKNTTTIAISGVLQQKSTYSLTGSTITFGVAPPLGTNNIEVTSGLFAPIATPGNLTVTTGKIADLAVTTGKIADLAVTTGKIAAGAVTLAKMADMATASLIGRDTAGTGAPEVLSAATSRSLLGIIPCALLAQGAAQTIATTTSTPLTFSNESTGGAYDLFACHSAGDPTKLTAPVTGTYVFNASVGFVSSAVDGAIYSLVFLKNGAAMLGGGYTELVAGTVAMPARLTTTSAPVQLTAGDYVQVAVVQTTGGNLNTDYVANPTTTSFAMWRLA